MKLDAKQTAALATKLGVSSGLMIILGYPGELIIEGDLSVRWMWWGLAMLPFLYVVYTLLIGLKGAIDSESNPAVASKLSMVCWATVLSWVTNASVPNTWHVAPGDSPPKPSCPSSCLFPINPPGHSHAQCTYPVVYVFPMLGFGGAKAVVAIQLGYCAADIISKCGVGFLIYNVTPSPPRPNTHTVP